MIKEWRENRKKKKIEKADPYDREELRLLMKLKTKTPGTDEYRELQTELKNVNIMRSESRESKRRICKADRGGIILKVLGIAGGGLGLFSIIRAEREGLTFTGEKRTIMDSIASTIGRVFVRN